MISIVSTYKNRRPHIEQTLATWLVQSSTNYEIIIVDYESDDDISSFLKESTSQVSIPVLHIRCSNKPIFELAHARNVGANYASGKYLFFVDIDTSLPEQAVQFILENMREDNYLAAVDSQTRKEIVNGGLIAVPSILHTGICGFNEDLKGWGFEDIDYKRRLEKAGLKYSNIPHTMYTCIDHPDDERVQCYEEEKEISWTKNRQIALHEWDNASFGQWEDVIVVKYGDRVC
jgi:glycosyltransferase involved in cell wall biosynthesis